MIDQSGERGDRYADRREGGVSQRECVDGELMEPESVGLDPKCKMTRRTRETRSKRSAAEAMPNLPRPSGDGVSDAVTYRASECASIVIG